MLKKLVILLLMAVLVVSVLAAQNLCIPGERDVVYAGQVLHNAWVTCVRTEYGSLDGYLPIGAQVEFERDGLIRVGRITHYQFTDYPEQWPQESRRPFVYHVIYDGGVIALEPDELRWSMTWRVRKGERIPHRA